jgi:hypothetical protein
MFTSVFRILTAAVVMGIALYPVAASAAPLTPAALAHSSSSTPSGSDPSVNTTVTFTVTIGSLLITAPASVDLGPGLPGGKIDGGMGDVVVTDNRANLAAAWVAQASATDWTTGTKTAAETIPAGDVTYDPGTVTTTGDITAHPTPITLSNTAQTVVSGTAGVGNNTATWDPALQVSVPAAAVGGGYTGTITDSVS